MPRNFAQGLAFVIGFAIALYLSPMMVKLSQAEPVPEGAVFEQLEGELLTAVNSVRARYNLIPLQRSQDLDRVAESHSSDMAQRNFMSHVTPEGVNPVDVRFIILP